MTKVLICDPVHQEGVKMLQEAGLEVTLDTEITPQELLDKVREYDALVLRSRTKLTKDVIERAVNLKAIARAGVGLDNIDLEIAKEKNIRVFNSPEAPANAVAELALGLILSLARNITQADSTMKQGKWEKKKLTGTEIRGKTLGLIGIGRIGQELGKKGVALGMNVLAYHYKKEKAEKIANQIGATAADLDTVLNESDYISLHVPINATTRNMICTEQFNKMKKSAFIVNTARGGIIDEKALIEALDTGRIAGAALDVYEVEPTDNQDLVNRSNVICSPHIGAGSIEAQIGNSTIVAEKLIKFFT